MLSSPMVKSMDGIPRELCPGDVVDHKEQDILSITVVGDTVLTGAQFARNLMEITGALGAGAAITLPTANQLAAALRGGVGLNTPPDNSLYGLTQATSYQWPNLLSIIPPGSGFRILIRNTSGQTLTMTAPASSGMAISGTATIANNKARLYLVKMLNSSPAATISATTTNTSKNLTNISPTDIAKVVVGMAVYGTGIGAAAVVDSVNQDTGTVHVTVASTATADLIGVSFTPNYTIQNLQAADV